MNKTIETMLKHSSVRQFTDEEIPREHLEVMIKAAQAAPSSHFIQSYSIILVSDQEKKAKLSEYANQDQVKNCPVLLLFCADYKRLEYAAKKHETDFAYDTLENLMVATVDASLAAQNLYTAAESLGYGGCYIGGIRNNPGPITEIVGLPDKVFPVFGMTLGVPIQDQEAKPRLPIEAIFHENEYNEVNYEEILNEYDETTKAYYAARTKNKKDIDWTTGMAKFFSKERRLHMKEYLKERGFTLN